MNKTPMATLAILLLAGPFPAAAQTQDAAAYFSFLSESSRKALLSKGELTVVEASPGRPALASAAPFASELASGLTLDKPTVAIEGFFLFPRPAGKLEPGLYNALNAVASMEGLEYYSVSRKQNEPLILASWRVVSQENRQRLADPVFASVPPFQKAVIFQKDNKLGEGLSEVTWKALPAGAVAMTIRNLQTLTYGIFPLVDPGNLQLFFVVVPLADKIAVYGAMEGKTAQLFGLEKSKDESFRNRMRALAAWLGQRIASLK